MSPLPLLPRGNRPGKHVRAQPLCCCGAPLCDSPFKLGSESRTHNSAAHELMYANVRLRLPHSRHRKIYLPSKVNQSRPLMQQLAPRARRVPLPRAPRRIPKLNTSRSGAQRGAPTERRVRAASLSNNLRNAGTCARLNIVVLYSARDARAALCPSRALGA